MGEDIHEKTEGSSLEEVVLSDIRTRLVATASIMKNRIRSYRW